MAELNNEAKPIPLYKFCVRTLHSYKKTTYKQMKSDALQRVFAKKKFQFVLLNIKTNTPFFFNVD